MNNRIGATRRTLARTRWLSELAQALERASEIARELRQEGSDDEGVALLSAQIRALRAEVEKMRRAKPASPVEHRPEWTRHRAG